MLFFFFYHSSFTKFLIKGMGMGQGNDPGMQAEVDKFAS